MNKLFRTVTVSQKNKKNRRHSDPKQFGNGDIIQLHPYQNIEHKIVIESLELMMSVGILPEEKQAKQRVIVSIEASMTPQASYGDDIKNTVSYADIIADIETLAQERHFDLVETLAEEISNLCLGHPEIMKVSVQVKKPDIIANVQSVGFSMVTEK